MQGKYELHGCEITVFKYKHHAGGMEILYFRLLPEGVYHNNLNVGLSGLGSAVHVTTVKS